MSTVPPTDSAIPNPAHSPQTAAPQPQIIVQQQATMFGRYGKFLLFALGIAVMSIFGLTSAYQSYFSPPGGPQEKYHSLSETADEKIAIIRVSGTIIEGDGFVKKQIDRVREDEDVVGVVLRIDSPGGTVTGSDYLYHHLCDLIENRGQKDRDLPLVVSMGSLCASGGYYMAMAVGDRPDTIFAEPTTWTGSIGVVIPHYDLSGLLERFNVKDDSVASHKYKLMGSPTRRLNDKERAEERALLQTLVDKSFGRFKNIVRRGRPRFKGDDAALNQVATGQIFTAQQALELGLVDKIGFIEEAIERVAELAGRDVEKLRCVKYNEPSASLSTLLSAQSHPKQKVAGLDLRTLLDMTAPRAFYLCTWLPSVLSNSGR